VRKQRQILRGNQAKLEARVESRTQELVQKNIELQREIDQRRRTEEQLQEKQRFLERTLNQHERDRQLVAYEIHDTFLQGVIGALMYVDAYYESRAADSAEALSELESARNLLRRSIAEARRMISGLRPPIIDEQGIVAAIEYLVNEMSTAGLAIEFSHSIQFDRLAPLVEAAIFRIVQEGLINVQRHSQSQHATVTIRQLHQQLHLEVRDFGVGFDPAHTGDGHFGLQGIHERARLVGGSSTIRSTPGNGASIVVTIPLVPGSSAG
jgi:signal transduction histidine kinase